MLLTTVAFFALVVQPARLRGTSDAPAEDNEYYLDGEIDPENQTWEDFGVSDSNTATSLFGNEVNNVTDLAPAEGSEQVPFKTQKSASEGNEAGSASSAGPDECGKPPLIPHSTLLEGKKLHYTTGDVVLYGCEFGYSVVGGHSDQVSECAWSEGAKNLRWSDPKIVCIPRSCGDPGFVAHARREGSLFTFPNGVTFECDEGFEVRGHGVRYCQPSGSWSGSLPTCEKVFCEIPSDPDRGRVSYSSLEYGSELRYTCEEGYLLDRRETRVCALNGTWTGQDPECREASCEIPIAPDHGSVKVVGEKAVVGSMALYTCDEGRILVGSATSKCLDIGVWTFAPPRCAEPCTVPEIQHGKIGKYENYHYNRKRFKELKPGEIIQNEEIILQCEYKYEPLGKPNMEEKIRCQHGEWSEKPVCVPQMCRTPPIRAENGKVSNINRNHGGTVVYKCNPHFIKAAQGNVTCHFGLWQGIPPTCKDRRCYASKLSFPGIVANSKLFYFPGQSFQPSCEEGYQATSPGNKLYCNQGTWEGLMPPCTAANCTSEPPKLEHGFVESYNVLHSSLVKYQCEDSYTLTSFGSLVQCLFGQWHGNPPTCEDGRCYLRTLDNVEGLSIDTEESTRNGESLRPLCLEGFAPTTESPRCSKGGWVHTEQACKESDCSTYNFANGRFTRPIRKRQYNFWKARFDELTEYIPVENRHWAPGTSHYISCMDSYTFQGRGTNNVKVGCVRGKWDPTPWCLPTGAYFREDKMVLRDDTSLIRNRKSYVPSSTSEPPAKDGVTSRRPDVLAPPSKAQNFDPEISPKRSPITSESDSVCYCTYKNGDSNVVAHAGTELLRYGSRVKEGCTVEFHCLHFGYARLEGSPQISCTECRDWHSSAFPVCHMPQRGDTILQIKGNWTLTPGGYVRVQVGETVEIRCVSNGVANYSEFIYPAARNVYELKFQELLPEGNRWIARLRINNASLQNQGIYRCFIPGRRANMIQLKVTDPANLTCPRFEEDNVFLIDYDSNQTLNSSAFFTCKQTDEKLVGAGVLTCMRNGQWSGPRPECKKTCADLDGGDGMLISYSADQLVGSRAAFHCFEPWARSGVSHTTCQENGEWADPTPTCDLPSCSLDSLFQVVPEDVIPDMESVQSDEHPYNSTLRLICERELKLVGSDIATCGKEGQWQVEKIQCVSGCPSLKRADSEVLVEPDKTFYRLGETLTFSCPPGLELTNDLIRVMCLSRGWSEKKVPSCRNV